MGPVTTGGPERGWAVAAAVGAEAVLTVVSALTPSVGWRRHLLETFEPNPARAAGHVVSLVGAVILLALLPGLLRGHRRAAGRAVAVLLVLAVAHAAKGLDYEEAGLALALALVLRADLARRRAAGRPGPHTRIGAIAVAALAGAFAVEVIALMVDGHRPRGAATLAGASFRLVHGGWPHVSAGFVTALWLLLAVGLAAGAVAVLALLRPTPGAQGHSAAAHTRAAELVAAWGNDSLAPFALRRDKAFFFSRGAFLAYRTLRETAVVSGDPVGPPGTAPAVVRDFLAFAAERGWEVVLTAASDRHLLSYRKLGLSVLRIGSEAVVDPSRFTLEGRAVRKLRQSVTRLARRGWSAEVVPADRLGPDSVAGIAAVELAWRERRRRMQGFAMAMDRLWGAPEDAHDLYVLARGPEGDVRAFLRFVRHRRGLSLDAMRRLEGAPNGLTEALVVAALAHAREAEVLEVSLNFAGFAHIMAADAALGHRQRVARWLLERLHGRFQLERLVAFNEKFSPAWRARYLVHSGRRRLPLAALRVLQAEAYVRPPQPRPALEPAGWAPRPLPVAVAAPAVDA
jgi:lysyl-tRNA synthetase, class II